MFRWNYIHVVLLVLKKETCIAVESNENAIMIASVSIMQGKI